jgi:uncharacterized protein
MSSNVIYSDPAQLPAILAIFPLEGALLLPRGQLPLNIFEPRYLAMVDDAMRGNRLIGMIQPQNLQDRLKSPALFSVGCAGRITQYAESGDGRVLLQLSGISRFTLKQEMSVLTPYRQAEVDFLPYADDLVARKGEDDVDRQGIITALRAFSTANEIEIDWESVESAPNEALVNALSMMSPFGAKEKQALLEAMTLEARAQLLIAMTEFDLARNKNEGETTLQ